MPSRLFVSGEFPCFASEVCTQTYLAHQHLLCVLSSGLSWATNDQSLKDAFSSFGEISKVSAYPEALYCVVRMKNGYKLFVFFDYRI